MNAFCRYILDLIIFCGSVGMINKFYNDENIICTISILSIIGYYIYRIYYKAYAFDFWDNTSTASTYKHKKKKGLFDSYDVYDSWYFTNNNSHTIMVYGNYFDEKEEIQKNIKTNSNENKIEVVETTQKKVVRANPIFMVSKKAVTKDDKNETKNDEKVVINPSEFNKELIMMVNDDKISKDITKVYDAIIKAMKDKNFATSKICTLLTAFAYVDIVDKNVVIYVNNRQIEGSILEALKRNIIPNIRENISIDMNVTFSDLKYLSAFDYFNKLNQL